MILVDAGSTDGSPEFVEETYPDIRLLRCGRIGIGEAVNIGIRNSSGEIIVFDLNTDEYVEPNWLEELIKQLRRHDFKIITGTTRIIYGTNLIDEAGVNINFFGKAKLLGHGKRIDYFDFSDRPVDYVGSPTFHRSLLDVIGPLDEDYFIYAEDADFCYRAKLAGIETRCAPLARSYHHIRGTTGKDIKTLEYFLRRAYIRFHIIHSPPHRLSISLFFTCFLLTFASFVGSISGLRKSHLFSQKLEGRIKAILWNIRNLGRNLRRRKQMHEFKRNSNMRLSN